MELFEEKSGRAASAPHASIHRGRSYSNGGAEGVFGTDSRRLCAGLLFALIVAFGVWLRLDQITEQIIADDEWHTLNFLCAADYKQIYLHFGMSDHCIPMTLLNKFISGTVGLSELWMRALPLLSGLVALVVLPAFVRPCLGPKTALLFAALLAISPVHVYVSRFARPNAVIFLLGLMGAFAFERFLSTGKRRFGSVYAACAILVPWFHPIMVPFMLAPIGFALLRELPNRTQLLARMRQLWPFAVAIAAGLMLLLAPPMLYDFDTIRARSGLGTFDSVTFRIGYDLLSGTERPSTRLLFAAAGLIGLSYWLIRRRALLAYFVFLMACQAGAIAYSKPACVGVPITALRYALPLVGIVLLLVAEGLTQIDVMLNRTSRGWLPRHLPSTLAGLAFVAWNPQLSPLEPRNAVHFRPNAWTNDGLYQGEYAWSDRNAYLRGVLLRPRISNFYVQLARDPPGDGASTRRIVEAPWWLDTTAVPFVAYQRIHRWPMLIGFLHEPGEPPNYSELPWPDARFRFRNFVNLADFEGLRARNVAYVVLHKNLAAELPHEVNQPALPSLTRTLARYTGRFGAPCFEDEDLIVFDVRSKP